jgi:lipopolysaccharide export LptBFGC system permease protein LptF
LHVLNDNKGISLVELIIGMTIMIIMIGAIFLSFGISLKSFTFNMTNSNYAEYSRVVMSAITNEIHSADTITSSFPNDHLDYKINGESRNIYIDKTTSTYVLVINRASTNPQIIRLASGIINSLNFSQNDISHPQNITVTITLLDSNNPQANQKSYSTTIHAPNL